MKTHLLNCKVCGSELKKTKRTAVCQCGWYISLNHKEDKKLNYNAIKGIMAVSLVLVLGVAYIGSWGSSSLSVISLKVQQLTGSLDQAEFTKLKNICMGLKKYNCVEKAYRSFYRSTGDLEVLNELAEFQYRRKDFSSARLTYAAYFQREGRDVKAAYNFARLLEKKGQVKSAEEYYKFALMSRPGTIQVTVMRSYIDLLVKTGQLGQARKELVEFKPLLKTASSLVHQEYGRWQKQVRG